MNIKLAIRNVRRSFRDYMIYFLTLTVSVAIFYAFNSIEAQRAMLRIDASTSTLLDSFHDILAVVSVAVSVILGGLIAYANQFIVRRRSKELGIYLLLGMGKRRVAQLLSLELLIIAVASFIVGLTIGVLASQGMSYLTAFLFQSDVRAYVFVFSSSAAVRTLLYFAVMFGIVLLLQTALFGRQPLVALLRANVTNERPVVRSARTLVGLFVVSVLLLGYTYNYIISRGLLSGGFTIQNAVLLGVTGTVLFFFTFPSLCDWFIRRNARLRFNASLLFIVRQVQNRANTAFLSMSVVCILLFFSIGVFATGFSAKRAGEKELELQSKFGVSVVQSEWQEGRTAFSDTLGSDLERKVHSFDLYASPFVFPKDFRWGMHEALLEKYRSWFQRGVSVMYMKQSDYVKVRTMRGERPIDIRDDDWLVTSEWNTVIEMFDDYLASQSAIVVDGKTVSQVAVQRVERLSYSNRGVAYNTLTFVVPDWVVRELKPIVRVTNVGMNSNDSRTLLDAVVAYKQRYGEDAIASLTRERILADQIGTSTMVIYVGIYLGLVSLITSAAILALQQLSDVTDHA
ncbi:MAG: FtsX-like permease family protein, partial [Bacilli bacterium]